MNALANGVDSSWGTSRPQLFFTSLQPALIYGETGSVDELVAAADTPFAIAKSVFCVWREPS